MLQGAGVTGQSVFTPGTAAPKRKEALFTTPPAAKKAAADPVDLPEITTDANLPVPVTDLEDEDDGVVDVDYAADGAVLRYEQYGSNTPTAGARARSLAPKGVWIHFKRLKEKSLRALPGPGGKDKPFTHVCTMPRCWRKFALTQDKGRNGAFLTTVAMEHMRQCHPEEKLSAASQAGVDKKAAQIMGGMIFAKQSTGFECFISPKVKVLTHAARFYIYSKQPISKATIEDPPFREMCQAYYEVGVTWAVPRARPRS